MRQIINYDDLNILSALNEFVIIPTKDFRNLVLTLIGTGISVMTVTIYSSNSETKPDLSVVAGLSNIYVPTQVINLDSHTLINGSTGISLVANGISRYELNENLNSWVGVKITAYTSGSLTVKAQLSTND